MKQHHSIWTPELVEISLPLAGITRRVLARAIDQLILIGVYTAIGLGGFLIAASNPKSEMLLLADLLICLVLFLLADFIYFWGCHTWLNGQTPGKMALQIRVVTARGGRINGVTAFIRSLFNILDNILFSGGLAALMILCTDQERRIADMAAGTIVIVDSGSPL